jgi:proline dehydrogenase
VRTAVVSRLLRLFVAGERVDDAVRVVGELAAAGIPATVDQVGAQAAPAVSAYRSLIDRLADAGLARGTDILVRPEALDDALDDARRICRTAAWAGATVTLARPADVDAARALVAALRADYPDVGITLDAALPRTESDCRALATAGSRVRLERGPGDRAEVDRAYVRCLKALLGGEGHPMIATHDPRLLEIAVALASRYGRAPATYELQMRYGVRTAQQQRLAAAGEQVRVQVVYGSDGYRHLVGRLAERPANLSLFLTSLISKK